MRAVLLAFAVLALLLSGAAASQRRRLRNLATTAAAAASRGDPAKDGKSADGNGANGKGGDGGKGGSGSGSGDSSNKNGNEKYDPYNGEDIQKYFDNPDELHKRIDVPARYKVIGRFPVRLIMSAPGHIELRNPAAVKGMAEDMKKKNSGSIFGKDVEKIVLNVFTKEVNGHVQVKSIEVMDGNHRLAAGLYAGFWKDIKDIPLDYVDIRVNGYNTVGAQPPRWIPLDVAKSATNLKFFEVPSSWGAKGPTAQVESSVSSLDESFPVKYRGVPLDKVIHRSMERVAGAKDDKGTK